MKINNDKTPIIKKKFANGQCIILNKAPGIVKTKETIKLQGKKFLKSIFI
jgi:hypothetical protein